MFWYILAFIIIWGLKFIPRTDNKDIRIATAFFFPLIMLGILFIWNIWARHLIGWPEVDTFEEFVLMSIF